MSQVQTLIPVMLKEGISISEGWLPESLQRRSLQAPAEGVGSVLQVAQKPTEPHSPHCRQSAQTQFPPLAKQSLQVTFSLYPAVLWLLPPCQRCH